MKNECVIKETLDAVVMQEAQIERLVERCRAAQHGAAQCNKPGHKQPSGIEESTQNTGLKDRAVKGIGRTMVSAAACILLLIAGAVTVYAVVSHSLLDRYKGSEEDIVYVSQLITGDDQTISMNGLQFAIEDYVFEESVGEGYFVLSITREDGTKPVIKDSRKLRDACPISCLWAVYVDELPYMILFEEMGNEEKIRSLCETTGMEKEDAWQSFHNISLSAGRMDADSNCYYVSFWTEEVEDDFAIYILQTDSFSVEMLEEKRDAGDGLFMTESVSEAVTFTYGQLGGTLNPFALELSWEGELPVPTYLQKPGEAPIEKITIVKKDGTEIALIEDFMPIKENLKWSSGGHSKDYRTGEEHAEDTYQLINLLNIHEVDYLLVNGEKVMVE